MATYTRPESVDSSAVGWYDETTNIIRMNTALGISEVMENVTLDTTTTGTLNFDVNSQGVIYLTDSATANRTINFRADSLNTLNSIMANGESTSVTILMTNGTTAYYLNQYLIDNDSTSLKWSGGAAPSGGNTSSVDIYTFSIVKKDSADFTIFGTQTQFA